VRPSPLGTEATVWPIVLAPDDDDDDDDYGVAAASLRQNPKDVVSLCLSG
jgi:hypothetical protein